MKNKTKRSYDRKEAKESLIDQKCNNSQKKRKYMDLYKEKKNLVKTEYQP